MASTQVTPTRMELTRTKKKLVTAIKGHKLLKDKRDELMRQFLDLVKVNMELREKVEAGIRSANKNFVIAKAGMDEATLNTALMAPKQEVDLEVGQKNVMSVDIPVFETKTRTADANDIYSYGFAFTSSDLDGAVKSLADILPDMLKLAETEKACQLMAAEIEKTRRRVNAHGACDLPEAQKKYQVYYRGNWTRNEQKHPDPSDEGERYDAGGSASLQRKGIGILRNSQIKNPQI